MNPRVLIAAAGVLFSASAALAAPCLPQWTESRAVTFAHRDVLTHDLDGDGMTEILSFSDTALTVRRITAGDVPPVATDVFTTTAISDFALTDMTGDGTPDLLVADNFVNTLTIVPGNGDGTFGTPVTTAVHISPTRLAVADFTGDGTIDAAFFSYSANSIVVWAGNGSGGLAESARTPLPSGPAVHALAAGDFDADGFADLVLTLESDPVHVRFGNGGGSFTAPLVLHAGAAGDWIFAGLGAAVVTADFDSDGDLDIVATRRGLLVFRNDGNRTFTGSNLDAEVLSRRERRLVAADVTGDGVLDIVGTSSSDGLLMTYRGNGDATFSGVRAPLVIPNGPYGDMLITVNAGQFDAEPGIDLLVANGTPDHRTYAAVFRPNCRATTMTVAAKYAVVSASDAAIVTVQLSPVIKLGPVQTTGLPPPSGMVRLFENETELAEATLANGAATIAVTGLAPGMHAIRAEYSGDGEYDPNEHADVVQRVVAATTTTALTTQGQNFAWGETITLAVDIDRSPDEGPFYGRVTLLRGGVAEAERILSIGWAETTFTATPQPGTHTFRARYEGNEYHPPSTSDIVTVVVAKAASRVGFATWQPRITKQGGGGIHCAVTAAYSEGNPSGLVQLVQGNTVVAERNLDPYGHTAFFYLPSLPAGNHYFRCSYEGDQRFLAATSPPLRYVVVPAEPLVIRALSSPTRIVLDWLLRPYSTSYDVFRRTPGEPWMKIGSAGASLDPSYHDTLVQPGIPYLYRVEAIDSEGGRVSSAAVQSMVIALTDDPLPWGTRIRALHVTELTEAVNILRTAVGLDEIVLSTAEPGQVIRGSHLQQLRDGVNEARAALLLPHLSFSDPVLGPFVPVRTQHIQQLRDAIR